MKRRVLSLLWLLGSASYAFAQPAPFDMSPERPPTPPAEQTAPVAVPAAPPGAVLPAVLPEPVQAAAPAASDPASAFKRYLLPADSFVLSGEDTARSWSLYLTAAQAASAATLSLGYQNAVVVAPEASRLRLSINGTPVADLQIESAEDIANLSFAVPANTLRSGPNDIRIEAVQRHRTDCTIQSTYELWTELDPSKTFLSFAAAGAGIWTGIDDLRAVGFNADGITKLTIVVPSLDQAASRQSLSKLAQGLALLTDMPNQSVTVTTARAGAIATPESGTATILLGTASDLRMLLPALPPGTDQNGVTTLVEDPNFGPTLVVSGPNWPAIETAIDAFNAPLDRGAAVPRQQLVTKAWRTPDAPMLYDAARLKFADLGVATREFAGRRFRTDLAIGVPSDFYANDYGEMQILLDAAYSPEVLPGSHIDVYVNDNIASTLPITTSGGEILRHFPIKVAMKHFQPGLNVIAIEAVLLTDADKACLPGATALAAGRFAMFDTSEVVMPTFARIAQLPNLAAMGGTGFPYGRSTTAIPVIIANSGAPVLSATSTLLARLAVAAGRILPFDLNAAAASVADKNALFVSAIAEAPDAALAQIGIAAESKTSWNNSVSPSTTASTKTAETFDEWRNRLSGSGWRGQVSSFQDWLNQTFDVSIDTFRLTAAADANYEPGNNITLAVAQQVNPARTGTWTMVTAPTADMLATGVNALTAQANWQRMRGHISGYDAAMDKVENIPANRLALTPTQPGSFTNYRLILANWLSGNALGYSLLLAVFSVALGLATFGMLGRLGRRQ